MVNYVIHPEILLPHVPAGTELDTWEGKCYISLVGFMFQHTRMLGIAIPYHTDFEEVNLRFYVLFTQNGIRKRGVVFIKELVPKPALSLVANTLYGEHYETVSMKHQWETRENSLHVSYQWKKSKWHTISVETDPAPVEIAAGSEAEFITEHYWGYTRLSATKTSEYEVKHPKWLIYPVRSYQLDVDFEATYGSAFGFLGNQKPHSVFLAEGSEIEVMQQATIRVPFGSAQGTD